MRTKAKTDDNHAEIVRAFRSVPGVKVKDTSRVGGGFPDIIVLHETAYAYDIYLTEIKDGSKPPSKRKLTPAQQKFHAEWPCHIVTCVADVWKVLGL